MDHEIVIIGGGAGGLELASRLGRKLGRRDGPEKVLLVDRSPYHVWKPTLHEVAAGTLDARQEGLSYAILARRNHFGYTPGEVVAFDPLGKRLTLAAIRDDDGSVVVPQRELRFRHAVLATGCGSNFSARLARPNTHGCSNAPRTPNDSSATCLLRSHAPRSRTNAACPSRSSARARPASNSRQNCSKRTQFCRMACTPISVSGSISPSSKPRRGSSRACRRKFRDRRKPNSNTAACVCSSARP
jgi:hypothetical protein